MSQLFSGKDRMVLVVYFQCVDTLLFASKHAKGMSLRYDTIFIRTFG